MSGSAGKLKHAVNLLRFCFGAETPSVGPLRVQWDVTYKCNSRCRHCHRWEDNRTSTPDLTFEEGRVLISELAASGTINLSFAGNEPLLREDIFDLVALANDQGLVTNLNSNGLLVNERAARQLCKAGLDMIYLSLDGATPETHDSIRGIVGSFNRVWGAVELLRRARGNALRPRIMINTVLNRENHRQITAIAQACRKNGVDGLLVQPIHNVEEQFEASDELRITKGQVPEINRQMADLIRDYSDLTPLMSEYYQQFDTFYRSPGTLYRYRCLAAYATVDVRPNGDIVPCPTWNERLGNVREDGSFPAVWNSSTANRLRNRIRLGQHPICWFACVVPMNLIVHSVKTGRLDRVLRPQLLAHVLRKVGKRDG